jgi:NADH-quinone oxidoreductase subunit G
VAHLGRAFVVYQGSHGDAGAHHAYVILPGAAYTEKDGLYANFEGRVQRGRRAVFPPGEAKEDWAVLRALSEVLGAKLPYDDRAALLRALEADVTHFATLNTAPVHADTTSQTWGAAGVAGSLDSAAVTHPMADFYLTNPIARASETMAQCSREFVTGAGKMAAE